jgi:hypothetical protein
MDRLAKAAHNPMMNEVSVRGARLSSHPSADTLAGKVSTYVATRLTIDQALEAIGGDEVSPFAWDSLSEQRRAVDDCRAQVPLDVFAQVFLNVSLRTFVKIRGVRADHQVQIFSRVDQLVQGINQRADGNAIVDDILESPPGDLYAHVSGGDAGDIDSLLKRISSAREACR